MHRRRGKLRQQVGFRGGVLLWLALLDVVWGLSLVFPAPEATRNASLRWMAGIAPLPAWGGLWLAVALILVVYAFRSRDAVAFLVAVGIKVLWACLSLGGWLTGHVDRGWVGSVFWVVLAALPALISRWPEPPPPLDPRVDMTARRG